MVTKIVKLTRFSLKLNININDTLLSKNVFEDLVIIRDTWDKMIMNV